MTVSLHSASANSPHFVTTVMIKMVMMMTMVMMMAMVVRMMIMSGIMMMIMMMMMIAESTHNDCLGPLSVGKLTTLCQMMISHCCVNG